MGYAAKLAAAAGAVDATADGEKASHSSVSDRSKGTGSTRCTELNKRGEPCKGNPMPSTGMCAGHSRAAGLIR